ncbi:MAG: hypothetical protein SFX73_02655 [Kofleriaceae bacterium]|nr:hypothetical protein [Kofleriaceae bacterium]
MPGTSVDDKDYQVPFRSTGKLEKLTVRLGPEAARAPEKPRTQTSQRDTP